MRHRYDQIALVTVLALCGLAAGCPVPPPPPPPPAAARMLSLTVSSEGVAVEVLAGASYHVDDYGLATAANDQPGHVSFLLPAGVPCAYGADLAVTVDGYLPWARRVPVPCGPDLPAVELVKAVAPVVGRHGPVRLQGRNLVDDDGQFLGLGATLMWAIWGEQHDPERLDANLRYLSEHGVDFVRILGQVGGPSWADRVIDPQDRGYWASVTALFERLEQVGLRAEVSIFGEAGLLSATERLTVTRLWAEFAATHPNQVILMEVANEHTGTGLPDIAELRMLGDLIADRTSVLMTYSATRTGDVTQSLMCAVYANGKADVVAMHYDRNRADGPWGSVRQPYGFVDEYDTACNGQIVDRGWNNEPIGPESGVRWDSSPLRLTMAAVNTWLTGDLAYVFHAGAGIRGGGKADLSRSPRRFANWYDQPTASATLDGIAAMRLRLPVDLPTWTTTAAHHSNYPFQGLKDDAEQGRLNRAYGALHKDGRMVLVFNGLRGASTAVALRALMYELLDPLTGTVLQTGTVAGGQTWTVTPRAHDGLGDGQVLIGRYTP